MRFIPGSHKGGIVDHADTFSDGNLLSRGPGDRRALTKVKAVNGPLQAW